MQNFFLSPSHLLSAFGLKKPGTRRTSSWGKMGENFLFRAPDPSGPWIFRPKAERRWGLRNITLFRAPGPSGPLIFRLKAERSWGLRNISVQSSWSFWSLDI